MIDLDELLNGSPSWEQVTEFFRNGEFHEESYLVEAIELYLQTDVQRQLIFDNRLSIEKMLNGRTQPQHSSITQQIYDEWNSKLGFKNFGA